MQSLKKLHAGAFDMPVLAGAEGQLQGKDRLQPVLAVRLAQA